MNELQLKLDAGDRNRFKPGERISGVASWKLNRAPKKAEIRLFWHTQGIGTRDVEVVETIPLEQPRDEDEQKFSLRLPLGPYSFSGKLITLQWALDLVIEPGDDAAHLEFDLTPFDDPIILEKVADLAKDGFTIRVGS